MTRKMTAIVAITGLAAAGPSTSEQAAVTAEAAHTAYVAAINSNDLDRFLASVTEDVVLMAPGTPVMEGKAEVAPWVSGYFDAVRTSWSKRTVEFVVATDWAFERYSFVATDVPHGSDIAMVSTGNGVNIYHLEDDGIWRVARDIWSNEQADIRHSLGVAPTCSTGTGPC